MCRMSITSGMIPCASPCSNHISLLHFYIRRMNTSSDEDSSVGMPGLTPGYEESSNSDEESSAGMPDLIDYHDDSSEEDTIEYSIGRV